MKKTLIRVSKEARNKLRYTGRFDQFGRPILVSEITVYNALAGRSNSDEAQRIRKEALEMYGGVTEKKTIFGR